MRIQTQEPKRCSLPDYGWTGASEKLRQHKARHRNDNKDTYKDSDITGTYQQHRVFQMIIILGKIKTTTVNLFPVLADDNLRPLLARFSNLKNALS